MATSNWLRGPTIGLGSTSTVFLATSLSKGEIFAVKSAEFSHSALLQHEKSILLALNSPAIISCFGHNIAPRKEGVLFYNLFLEYASGGSLRDHIKLRGGRLDEPAVRFIAHDILTGLAYLHCNGVVHCDIKPENILLSSSGRAKIGDFGCSRWLAAGDREIRGTPAYMAPEALRGEGQGMSADVWSMGCAVIEMFTGRRPWREVVDVAAAVRRIGFSGEAPEIPAWVSEEARDFLDKCLRKEAEERWTAEMLLRHPFAAGGGGGGGGCGSWVSPKSILDFGLWEEVGEEVEDGGEEFCGEEMARRICEIAAVSGEARWDWNEEWVEVREEGGGGDVSSLGGEDCMNLSWKEKSSSSCNFCYLGEVKSREMSCLGCKVKSSRFWNVDCWGFLMDF